MGLNLEVPIEMLDYGAVKASTGAITFNKSSVTLNPDDYDGSPTFYFEVVATNGNTTNDYAVNLMQGGSSLASVTITHGTGTTPTRYARVEFTPTAGDNTYQIQIAATGASTDVKVYAARIIVVQTNATKTRIQIPLLNATYSGSAADGTTSNQMFSTTGTNWGGGPAYAAWWKREDVNIGNYAATNPFRLEVVAYVTSGQTGYAGLYDNSVGHNGVVVDSQITVTGGSQALYYTDFGLGSANFYDGDTYEVEGKMAGATGSIYFFKAALYIKLENLWKCPVYIRTSLRTSTSAPTAAAILNYQRYLFTSGNYTSPSYSFEAIGYTATAQSNDLYLHNQNTADSGTTGSDIASSAINMPATKSRVRVDSVAVTDGRYCVDFKYVGSALMTLSTSWLIVKCNSGTCETSLNASSGNAVTLSEISTHPRGLNASSSKSTNLTTHKTIKNSFKGVSTNTVALIKKIKKTIKGISTNSPKIVKKVKKTFLVTSNHVVNILTKKTIKQSIVSSSANVAKFIKTIKRTFKATSSNTVSIAKKNIQGKSFKGTSSNHVSLSRVSQYYKGLDAAGGVAALLSELRTAYKELDGIGHNEALLFAHQIKTYYQTIKASTEVAPNLLRASPMYLNAAMSHVSSLQSKYIPSLSIKAIKNINPSLQRKLKLKKTLKAIQPLGVVLNKNNLFLSVKKATFSSSPVLSIKKRARRRLNSVVVSVPKVKFNYGKRLRPKVKINVSGFRYNKTYKNLQKYIVSSTLNMRENFYYKQFLHSSTNGLIKINFNRQVFLKWNIRSIIRTQITKLPVHKKLIHGLSLGVPKLNSAAIPMIRKTLKAGTAPAANVFRSKTLSKVVHSNYGSNAIVLWQTYHNKTLIVVENTSARVKRNYGKIIKKVSIGIGQMTQKRNFYITLKKISDHSQYFYKTISRKRTLQASSSHVTNVITLRTKLLHAMAAIVPSVSNKWVLEVYKYVGLFHKSINKNLNFQRFKSYNEPYKVQLNETIEFAKTKVKDVAFTTKETFRTLFGGNKR